MDSALNTRLTILLNGLTSLYYVVGHPTKQMKAPFGITERMQSLGYNTVCVPADVKPENLAAFFAGAIGTENLAGFMVTVPHKISFVQYCNEQTERSKLIGCVNVVKKTTKGWKGDMCDGIGYIRALRQGGCEPSGKRALLVGTGGAGRAIAFALVMEGVAELAICELDEKRRESIVAELNALNKGKVVAATNDPSGYELVINATPLGMKENDPLPIQTDKLQAEQFLGDVVAVPEMTPWLLEGQKKGCKFITGVNMFAQVRESLVEFFLDQE